MAVPRALRRLLHIRSLEEEQRWLALESAIGELKRLERALAATAERDRRGRRFPPRYAPCSSLRKTRCSRFDSDRA